MRYLLLILALYTLPAPAQDKPCLFYSGALHCPQAETENFNPDSPSPKLDRLLRELKRQYNNMPYVAQIKGPSFNPASFARAVNYFVSLGETEAINELKKQIRENQSGNFSEVYHNDIRVSEICRVLFESRDGNPIRPPGLGALMGIDFDQRDRRQFWPLFPVAQSGSSYFILGEGYILGGVPEDIVEYIEYSRRLGRFRITPLPVPTRAQAAADAELLRKSQAWRDSWPQDSIKLNSDNYTWHYIQSQVQTIPESD